MGSGQSVSPALAGSPGRAPSAESSTEADGRADAYQWMLADRYASYHKREAWSQSRKHNDDGSPGDLKTLEEFGEEVRAVLGTSDAARGVRVRCRPAGTTKWVSEEVCHTLAGFEEWASKAAAPKKQVAAAWAPSDGACPATGRAGACPVFHGTVYADPYPGYVHGKNPSISKHGAVPALDPYPGETAKEKLLREAREFQVLFHHEMGNPTEAVTKRMAEITRQVEETGTYTHTFDELQHGARVAWRNAPKCSNRKFWSELVVMDKRGVATNAGIWEACLEHLELAMRGGVTAVYMTVFAPCTPGQRDGPQIWNDQLIRFAGHRNDDMSVCGDPANLALSSMLKDTFGWKPRKIGMFDYLPVVIHGKGQEPEMFEYPPTFNTDVHMWHPSYPFIAGMKLVWYAVPTVCNLDLEIGGLTYRACPFNGWYASNEIVRNFADEDRYNVLEQIAEHMGLDTTRHDTLWRDEALLALNKVVLHSFSHAGYGIVDHHTLIRNFLDWYNSEMKHRGYCPGNWKWLIPPFAASQSPAYMQLNRMTEYTLKPAFVYGKRWKFFHEQHFGKRDRASAARKLAIFAILCRFVGKMKVKLRRACPLIFIAYASVSGNTRRYAGQIAAMVSSACRVEMLDLATFKESDSLEFARKARDCDLLVLLSSTYGNGEVPHQGKALEACLEKGAIDLNRQGYVVLGFGSKKYPKFCEAGKRFDFLLEQCNGLRVHDVGLCDAGNEVANFNEWFMSVASAIIKLLQTLGKPDKWVAMASHTKEHFYSISAPKEPNIRIEALDDEAVRKKGRASLIRGTSLLRRSVARPQREPLDSSWMTATVLESRPLIGNPTSDNKERATSLVRLDISKSGQAPYAPGDHLLVMPEVASGHTNAKDEIRSFCQNISLDGAPLDPDQIFMVHGEQESLSKEQYGLLHAVVGQHVTPSAVFTLVADLMSPVSIQACLQLASLASGENKARLRRLGSSADYYTVEVSINAMKWISIFDIFPSLKSNVTLEFILRHVPLNHARYYSISSSKAHVGEEIHLTVGRRVYASEDENVHVGLASNFLTLLQPGDLVKFKAQTAADFHMPLRPEAPILMIATGTGIAPFRGFWQERLAMAGKLAPMLLVLGCRTKSEAEGLYLDELKGAAEQGVLEFFHAYSREPGQPKQHVQDVLGAEAARFKPLLGNGQAHVYLCGGAHIATHVKKALRAVDASGFDAIVQKGNYHEDIFGVLA